MSDTNPSHSNTHRRLRDIPSLDYRQLHETGARNYRDRFTVRRSTTHENPESDCSSNASSPTSSIVSSQSTEETQNQLPSTTFELRQSLLVDASFKMSTDDAHDVEGVEVSEEEEQLEILQDELNDFLDENRINVNAMSAEDYDAYIERMEEYRKKYKTVERTLKKKVDATLYKDDYSMTINDALNGIKNCIMEAKSRKSQLRQTAMSFELAEKASKEQQRKETQIQSQEAAEFLVQEVFRIIAELKSEFEKTTAVDDEELLRRKEDYSENSLQMERLSNKIQQTYQILPANYDVRIVNRLKLEYDAVVRLKKTYDSNLEAQIKERELLKEKAFQTSALNINIPMFKGYQSTVDIYTFQSEFEKLYLRTTPKKLLPDLLKNNYLGEPALSMVKSQEDIDEIWRRLKKAYGDKKVLLQNKLSCVVKIGNMLKSRDFEQLKEGLMKIINTMHDLISLAERHNIENKLYFGDGLNTIYKMLGDSRLTRWLSSISEEDIEGKALWTRLITFLEKELKIVQEKALVASVTTKDPPTEKKGKDDNRSTFHNHDNSGDNSGRDSSGGGSNSSTNVCHFCNEDGHKTTFGPNKTQLVQYFACEKFCNTPIDQRFRLLREKDLCHQCLFPGAKQGEGNHKEGKCQKTFACKHPSHDKYPRKKHVLVCAEHCDSDENKKLFEEYKSRFILKQKRPLDDFSKELKLSFHVQSYRVGPAEKKEADPADDGIPDDSDAIYGLQRVEIDGERYLLFYDGGSSDSVTRHCAIVRLKGRAVQESSEEVNLGGVSDVKVTSPHGVWRIKIPMHNGKNASMSGICLDKITEEFPTFKLNTQVRDDIERGYQKSGRNIADLPTLPDEIGGSVDIMIGARYLRYHPKEIFQLPSGLTIYESKFVNADGGGRGVICGPHPLFNRILKGANVANFTSFLTQQYKLYRLGYQINPDANFITPRIVDDVIPSMNTEHYLDQETEPDYSSLPLCMVLRQQKLFEEVENAGSVILYRCIDCRGCMRCKGSEHIEVVSLQEEFEQELIIASVVYNPETKRIEAILPFKDNPLTKLAPNREMAFKIYMKRVKQINKCEQDRLDTIASEAKLQLLGYVQYVRNLTPKQQQMLKDSPIQNFITWFPVWSLNSVTTSCRPVFDASLPTPSGDSLNSILAKGTNNMNRLVEIVIRWSMYTVALHTDVKQMYNRIQLKEEYWCFQRYVWQEDLDPSIIPEEKVVMTPIFGVISSGYQAERGLRMTADMFKESHPEVHRIIHKDLYADDCLSGAHTEAEAFEYADGLEEVLGSTGFYLKGFSFSGHPPNPEVSKDGVTINLAGLIYYVEEDEVQLNVTDRLNFSKKRCGKKDTSEESYVVPKKLERLHCASKVAEIFDLTGRVGPITGTFKVDLHELTQRKLKWDDVIPDEFRPLWLSNFELMKELRNIRFKRAIIPADAVSLTINTIDAADASKNLACAAIYARFLRKNGSYSCQLVFSRSKLLPEGTTQPRAELIAAVLNAHTGEVVRRSFGKYHEKAVKLTDSQIVLHWVNNADLRTNVFVRNRVIECRRYFDPLDLKYVKSADMVADIGTRSCRSIDAVGPGSVWQEGLPWMKEDESSFPTKDINQIKLDCAEKQAVDSELIAFKKKANFEWPHQATRTEYVAYRCGQVVPTDIELRYSYSEYLIDPNKHRYRDVLRIMGIVKLFVRKFIRKYSHTPVTDSTPEETVVEIVSTDPKKYRIALSDRDVALGAEYFYKKATKEVKHFTKDTQFKHISAEKNDILYYTGRFKALEATNPIVPLTSVMKDLSDETFVIPIVEKNSPLAYSIVNEVHWDDPVAKHSGVETVLRYTMKHAYIMEGRELVKKVRRNCERCRYLAKRTIEVCMGPTSSYNLTIAPAFFITQVDLTGPYKAYTPHNKRSTIKIYLAVFCCATTGSINIKVMDSYDTGSFIQAFIRLSCEVGYPKILLTDEGSQLIKACKTMSISFQDAKHKLHINHSVEFEVCPVGGHNMHGRVERKIKQVKESLEKTLNNERLSVIEWETVGAEISNCINDLPVAFNNWSSDLENLDLITPNRLRLGRNNDRSPIGPLFVTTRADKFIETNAAIFNSWFEHWLISCVPQLVHQPKWFRTDYDLKQGDLVLFLKEEGSLVGSYQFGMIDKVEVGKDDKVRTVHVRYHNHNENISRITRRAVRELIMIHPVDELNIMQELGEVATYADMKCRQAHDFPQSTRGSVR